jgi:hypothetical protein
MKVRYMLLNRTGKARKIPAGEAWQWNFYVEDEDQLAKLLSHLKREIRDNRLTLANLVIERHRLESPGASEVAFAYKGPIIYDSSIHPRRIINQHAELVQDISNASEDWHNPGVSHDDPDPHTYQQPTRVHDAIDRGMRSGR